MCRARACGPRVSRSTVPENESYKFPAPAPCAADPAGPSRGDPFCASHPSSSPALDVI
jgi:hypothetical protein